MPRIKLVRVHASKYGYYSTAAKKAGESITDWEDVTHEELKFLKSSNGKEALINRKEGFEDYIIVEKIEKSEISSKLQNLRALIDRAKETETRRKAELRKKQEEKQQAEERGKLRSEQIKIDKAKQFLTKKGMKVIE